MTAAAAPAASTTTATDIHSVVPGFAEGVTFYEGPTAEGGDGDWSACGPFALGVCLSAVKKQAFTGDYLNQIIARMTAAKRFVNPGGCTIEELQADIEANEPTIKADMLAGLGLTLDAYHAAIKDCMMRGNVAVGYVTNAQGVPNNEQGVHGHFIPFGGIDSTQGYFILNGDRVPDNVPNAPYWVGWDGLANGQLAAVLEISVPWYSGVDGPPPPQPPTPAPAPAPEPPAPAPPSDPYKPVTTPANWWQDDRTGALIGDGIHTYALTQGLGACTLGETLAPGQPSDGTGITFAVFADATTAGASHVVEYRPAADPHAVESEAGLVVAAYIAALAPAQTDADKYAKLHTAVLALANF